MTAPKKPIQMAVIGAAHGIKGEVRVKTFTGDPLALGAYGPLHAKDGRSFEVTSIRPAGTVVVVRFKGINDRSAAEALAGTDLFIDRSMLPDDGEEDEFYHADLIGLSVRDGDGAVIGKVDAVHNFGGGDMLELTFGGRKGVLVPFTQAAVPEVSISGAFVRVDPATAGLLDDEDDAEGDPEPSSEDKPAPRPRGPKDVGGDR